MFVSCTTNEQYTKEAVVVIANTMKLKERNEKDSFGFRFEREKMRYCY